jgi:hypothetical protein
MLEPVLLAAAGHEDELARLGVGAIEFSMAPAVRLASAMTRTP